MSFWGGCAILSSDSTITCWGQSTGYGYNSQPVQSDCTASDCSAVSLTLSPRSGTFSTIACGGKRNGHFCCAVSTSSGNTECFGAGSESANTPSDQSGKQYYYLSCGTDFCCGLLASPGSIECFGNLAQADSSSGTDIPSNPSGTYLGLACGNFACYFFDSGGTTTAYGRVFSSDVGPVPAGTDTKDLSGVSGTITWLPTVAGFAHACAGSNVGAVYCWGADYLSQVSNAPSSGIVAASGVNSVPNIDWAATSPSPSPTVSPTMACTPCPTAPCNFVFQSTLSIMKSFFFGWF